MGEAEAFENSRLLNPFKFLLERILGVCAAGFLFLMMLLTFVDVVGRKLFDAPVPGGFEITELMLASLIFLGLPLVTAANEHVCVDLFDAIVPERIKPIQNVLVSIIVIGAFAVLAWKMWGHAFRTYQYADTTAVLQIPYTPLVFLMALMATLTTLAQVLMLFANKGRPIMHNDNQIDLTD